MSAAFPTADDSPLTAALAYAAHGLPVLPLHTPYPALNGGCPCRRTACVHACTCLAAGCASVGKHPRTRHGKDDASTDPERIRWWASMWPAANWGVRPPDGVVVVDIDPRNGGDTTMAALVAELGPLPSTLTARTGSGGGHVWLALPGPVRGKLGIGVDLKSHTGYVAVAPSIHAAGDRYRWTTVVPVAHAPGAWRHAMRPAPATTGAAVGGVFDGSELGLTDGRRAGLAETVIEALPGERNRRLHWAACRIWEATAGAGDREALEMISDCANVVGLDDAEIARTIESARRTVLGAAGVAA